MNKQSQLNYFDDPLYFIMFELLALYFVFYCLYIDIKKRCICGVKHITICKNNKAKKKRLFLLTEMVEWKKLHRKDNQQDKYIGTLCLHDNWN